MVAVQHFDGVAVENAEDSLHWELLPLHNRSEVA
jgi:hypothetical protein